MSEAALLAQRKSERRIYLWDVTLSMKGYNGSPDIYDEVVAFLEKEINSLINESTEIVVLPFQERILETWRVRANEAGKKTIISNIKSYKNNDISYTNIVQPLIDVQNNILSNERRNIVYILTDGGQSSKFGGEKELLNWIHNWKRIAISSDAYALYVMLTPESIIPEVIDKINQPGNTRINVITEPGKMEFIELLPAELVKFNIKDDNGKPANVPLICNKDVVWPNNMKAQIIAENNPYIQIDQTVVVANSRIAFKVEYKQSYQELKNILPETTRIPIHLRLVNSEEIQKDEGKVVSLTRNEIVLELINKPEKTLRIHVKK
jgi:hypothetical protein